MSGQSPPLSHPYMFSTTRWWLNSKHESFISHTMLSNPSKRVFSGDSKITRTPSSHNDSERQTFLMWSVWPPDWQMTRQNILFSANSPNPQDRSVTNKGGQPPKQRALLILQGPVKNKQTKQKKNSKRSGRTEETDSFKDTYLYSVFWWTWILFL